MSTAVADGSYFGATALHRQLGGLTMAETTYAPRLEVPAHAHASGLAVLIVDGAMTEHRGRRRILCEAGSMLFHPRDEAHAHTFSERGGRCFVLQLGDGWVRRMGGLELVQPRSPLALRGGPGVHVLEGLRRELRAEDDASGLAVESLVLALLFELERAHATREPVKPRWLLRAVDILHERTSGRPRMADVALEVGVHPVHLSRTFALHYGCTMGEYLRRLRVEAARRMLAATDEPLSAIAFEAGFSDQAHFTRVFKGLMGVTPGAYRASAGRS